MIRAVERSGQTEPRARLSVRASVGGAGLCTNDRGTRTFDLSQDVEQRYSPLQELVYVGVQWLYDNRLSRGHYAE